MTTELILKPDALRYISDGYLALFTFRPGGTKMAILQIKANKTIYRHAFDQRLGVHEGLSAKVICSSRGGARAKNRTFQGAGPSLHRKSRGYAPHFSHIRIFSSGNVFLHLSSSVSARRFSLSPCQSCSAPRQKCRISPRLSK